MNPTPEDVARYYAVRVPNLPNAEWRGPCPIHGGQRDSFVVQSATGLWVCHSECGRGGDIPRLEQELAGGLDIGTAPARVQRILGKPVASPSGSSPPTRRELEAIHPYVDEAGKILFEVLRFKNPKSFTQRRRGPDGNWIYDLDGVRRILYRLPEVLKASHVIIVEGERDVETPKSIRSDRRRHVTRAARENVGLNIPKPY